MQEAHSIGAALRIAMRVVALMLFLSFCLVGYGIARLTGGGPAWIRRFLGGAAWLLGADVSVAGNPLDRNVLFVANHLSWFDILAMGGATGTAFVSKDGIAGWPVIGWLARIGGTIFIARTTRTSVRSQADTLAAALSTGRPVTLFPEGTTNDGRTILPFRAPLLAAANVAMVRVQPVAIDYGAIATGIAWGSDESAPSVARRLVGRRGRIPIVVHFLPPLDPAQDRKQSAVAARAAIVQHFGARAGG